MTVALSISSRVQLATQQVSCDLDGDAVVLNLENGLYFELNPVGAHIWSLLQEGQSLTQICDTLVAEYGVDRDVCSADLISLVQDLREAGLVTVSD
jgi:Coenzyme PQQ synthesis protein D (PqqD)